MTAYGLNMPTKAIYWPPGVSDGYGGFSDGDAVSVKTRWEDKSVLYIDANGEEQQSSSIVYVNTDVETAGHLFESSLEIDTATESELTEARNKAREIRAVNRSPSIDGTKTLIKAIL